MLLAPLLLSSPHAQDVSADAWVRETLASMSFREKVGQMFMDFHYSRFMNRDGPEFASLRRSVADLGMGGICLSLGTAPECAALANELQSLAKIPLLLAADFESGAGFRIEGATAFPSNMAIGATGSEEIAFEEGRATAAEARALGVHWNFAPVLDVQRDPENPIVNVRSYGEDPALVSVLGAAFVRGCQAEGILCTAKHFPGHGATSVDSHVDLPTIPDSLEELEKNDFLPFREAVRAGVRAFMPGHLDVPALTGEPGLPASLSSRAVEDLLRKQMGFGGLVVTDALNMGGIVKRFSPGEAAVRAVLAGNDVLLMSPNPSAAIEAVARAVERGEIPAGRVDRSVERLLRAKAGLGLHRGAKVDPQKVWEIVGRREHRALAGRAAEASITALRNGGGTLPLDARRSPRVLLLTMREGGSEEDGKVFEREVRRRAGAVRVERVDADASPPRLDEIARRAADGTDVVVVAIHLRPRAWRGTVDLPDGLRRLADSVGAKGIFFLFGNPYVARSFPKAPAILLAYGSAECSEKAAARALFGEIPIRGKCPVSIPRVGPVGSGLEIPPLEMRLRAASEAGPFEEVFAAVERGIAAKAFPGAVCAIGRNGILFGPRAFGRLSSEEGAPLAAADAVYDLASLTKVVAATTAAMILHDQGKLSLDAPVRSAIPEFSGGERDRVTLRHLLTHSSGLPAFGPLWKDHAGKRAFVEAISKISLERAPGSKTVYSDYGAILLGEAIERIAGEPLDRFCDRRIFGPLGMKQTGYLPGLECVPQIAPTELDPRRGGFLHGRVHDENADAMGGVSAHAGLFSTAGDLAVFCQMLLWGGVYDHSRIASARTVEAFTRRAGLVPGSSRALGWDTPSEKHFAAALGPDSFGHTGFTGTSTWCVPEKNAFVVLLTNRVHPTRENRGIDAVRREVHEAFARALASR